MSKHTTSSVPPKRAPRPPAGWRNVANRTALEAVEAAVLATLLAMRAEIGNREPTARELAERVGLREPAVRATLERLDALGFTRPLTEQQSACIGAILTLEARLGRSPTTTDVSDEMGLSASASRYHINQLAAMGLVTPPERVLVLRVTAAGVAVHRHTVIGAKAREMAAQAAAAPPPAKRRRRRAA